MGKGAKSRSEPAGGGARAAGFPFLAPPFAAITDAMSETPNRSLLPILRPDSVAVIGASDTPSRIGGRPIHSMKTMGYGGRIYPVNRGARPCRG